MNWGRKKADTSSARQTRMSSIYKMFHVSWFSRSKQGNGNGGSGEKNGGRKVKRNAERDVGLQQERMGCRAEKFYEEAEENFWRLSFGDDSCQGRKSCRGSSGTIANDWHNEVGLSPSTCRSRGAKDAKGVVKNESMDFSDMVLDLRKRRGSNRHVKKEPGNTKVSRRDGSLRNIDNHQLSYSPNRVANYASLKGADKKMVGEKTAEGDPIIQNSAVKDIMEVKPVKLIQTSTKVSHRSPSSSSSQKHHDQVPTPSKLNRKEEGDLKLETLRGSICDDLGEVKLKELSLGEGEERKSIYISKDSLKRRSKSGRSSKVKIYSPRTPSKAELCKIKALEDLKKTRMKMRVREKEDGKERALLESFAVVKCSFDPQKDFRNSMLEMILDKGIRRAEELEELLACYLTLNSDEYHDLIIKVFRQVWFDLNKDRLDPRLRGDEKCNN
ncbi:unnamed protein product [Rhodiola kirilowii]